MTSRALRRVSCTVVGCVVFFGTLTVSGRADAQTGETCAADGTKVVELSQKALAKHGRAAEFETLFVQGNKTAVITLHEPHANASGYTFYAAMKSRKEQRPLHVVGIDKDPDGQIQLVVRVPDVGWFWPRRTFFVLGCTDSGQPALAAELAGAVSNREQAELLSIVLVAVVYVVVAFLRRKSRGEWTFSPFQLTAGLTGRSSISNLQTFFFTLIVVGLVAYILTRRGELSDLSATVVLLLGIVAGSTVAARWTANVRDQLSATNLQHLQALGWLPHQIPAHLGGGTERTTLVSHDGELDVTRLQALAFSLVVGAALVIRGSTDLARFEVPENLLALLFASQAIYIGGKWIQPDKSGEQFTDLNTRLDEMRTLELKVRQEAALNLVAAATDAERQHAITQAPSFGGYHAKASTAAEHVASLLGVKRPTAGLFGVQI